MAAANKEDKLKPMGSPKSSQMGNKAGLTLNMADSGPTSQKSNGELDTTLNLGDSPIKQKVGPLKQPPNVIVTGLNDDFLSSEKDESEEAEKATKKKRGKKRKK